MTLLRVTAYDGSKINIVMENVLTFESNDQGGTLFLFNVPDPSDNTRLTCVHVRQSEEEVHKALNMIAGGTSLIN